MPDAPLRPCRGYPSCSALVRGSGFCGRCKAKRDGQRREYDRTHKKNQPWKGGGSPTARGYGDDWVAARMAYLGDHPVCEICHHAPTRIVHHLKPIAQYPDLRLEPSNMMGVCSEVCHREAERRR